ncbi:MAG TPA: DUF202 domain-containing protein [Candidatus Aenigmarchaeota archaeon]|nr:DUF202 domain-containing protein [Candidatus Aenigmarchaeota archaeon]
MPRKSSRKEKLPDQKNIIILEEQLILSEERTALSFMRTGLAFVGAGIVIINVFPENATSYVLSWMLILIGVVLLIQYAFRLSDYRKKIKELNKKLKI